MAGSTRSIGGLAKKAAKRQKNATVKVGGATIRGNGPDLGEGRYAERAHSFALREACFSVFSAIICRFSTTSAKAQSTAKATIPWIAAGPNIIGSLELAAINTAKMVPSSAPTATILNSIPSSIRLGFIVARLA